MCCVGVVSLDRSPSFICGFLQFPMGAILVYITFILICHSNNNIYCAAAFIYPACEIFFACLKNVELDPLFFSSFFILFLFSHGILLCVLVTIGSVTDRKVGTRRTSNEYTHSIAIMWTMWINSNLDSEGWTGAKRSGHQQRPAIQVERSDQQHFP